MPTPERKTNRAHTDRQSHLAELRADFRHWRIVQEIADQLIDFMLNLRQSGHPGGSRSKVHLLVATLLSGAMRWDIRAPGARFADRFLLAAGHAVPLVYATLAVLAEAMRITHARTRNRAYALHPSRTLFWENLLGFRRRGGLPGHAEMSGKTHFLKFNTGPSGHGLPVAAGQALALRRAGAPGVRVFALEGEGGLTPGAAHETRQSAWGLGLGNLQLLLDWNDFGIDPHPVSSVVPGTPRDWFAPAGWRVCAAEPGDDWEALVGGLLELTAIESDELRPGLLYARTRKGRGYGKYDHASHGTPHSPMNCAAFWETKRPFMERYGVTFAGYGQPAPESEAERREQTRTNFSRAVGVLREHSSTTDYLARRLCELAEAVPREIAGACIASPSGGASAPASRDHDAGSQDAPGEGAVSGVSPCPDGGASTAASPCSDLSLFDPRTYPDEIWARPGESVANKEALGRWGGWINDTCRARYGRPLFLACSADLAHSTSIAGFAGSWGWYDRRNNPGGALLPQEITEFANAGLMVGVAATNFAADPWTAFDGFYGACSTYGAFVYLKYGLMRLFSQVAQDSQLRVGKLLWVAGHSGPETADDSRTHFGIFAPGVTQLFPRGSLVELHPWEHNEVPVLCAAAMRHPAPLVALHLTRPPIAVPDRRALRIPNHLAAQRGAYLLRRYRPDRPRMGTVIVQGTSTTQGVIEALPGIERRGLNVKIVAALSPQLFESQEPEYRQEVLSEGDRWDAMCITNRSLQLMRDWVASDLVKEYSLSSDWDGRWRTGGTVAEVLEEAHLTSDWILGGIERFARDRRERLRRVRRILWRLEASERGPIA
ncbi:MAG: transketolase [Candidatus Eisenbacteria bacterium]|nr:transketolase [Candidatus Eisenbacteria bacterium]